MRPKTQEEKEMQGTFEPSKEIESVELDNWDGQRMPAAPDGWPPSIQKIWNDRCKDLFKAGYLAKAFLPHLKRYCFAILQADEAEERLSSEGFMAVVKIKDNFGKVTTMTTEKPSPWLAVLDQANKTIDKVGSKFGFTPLDIQKIPVVKKAQNDEGLLK